MTCERHAKDLAYRQQRRANPEILAHEAAQNRARYGRLNGWAYNKLLLRHRRNKALTRMAQRHVPKEKEA